MNRKLILLAVALGLWTGTAQAAADWQDRLARKDLQIANDVASSVNGYASFTIFDDISINVDQGVVTLAGKVTMPFKSQDIVKRVKEIDGVKEVHDKIGVLPVSSWDDELRYRIARAIYGNSNFWNYAIMANPPIHIIVEHGRVTLTGVVQNDVDRMMARAIAVNFNAFSVTNNLKTDAEIREAKRQESD
jgi:hyperosmotically inducible protein